MLIIIIIMIITVWLLIKNLLLILDISQTTYTYPQLTMKVSNFFLIITLVFSWQFWFRHVMNSQRMLWIS